MPKEGGKGAEGGKKCPAQFYKFFSTIDQNKFCKFRLVDFANSLRKLRKTATSLLVPLWETMG